MVVWTRASTGAEGGFVKDEAARAARRQILVPVTLDKVEPPLGFGELQAVDRGADVDAQEWTCEAARGGIVCGFEGRALCSLDALSKPESETCDANPPR